MAGRSDGKKFTVFGKAALLQCTLNFSASLLSLPSLDPEKTSLAKRLNGG